MGNAFTAAESSAAVGESTLSGTRTDLLRYIGRDLGISRTAGNWDADQAQDVADIIESGERSFYQPEVLPGERNAHVWSFMEPLLSTSLTAPYATGTVSVTTGTATLVGGTWPTWAADGTLVIAGTEYEVATRTSNSVIVLEDTTLTGVSASAYSLTHWRYEMPDGFGEFIDPSLTYAANDNVWHTLALTSVGKILSHRQRSDVNPSTFPLLAAVNVKSSDHTSGQRKELLVYPTPLTTVTVTGPYYVLPNAVSSGAPYPLGGQPHFETLLASCRAAAELTMNGERGVHYANFMKRLQASIALDRKLTGAKYFGSMNESSDRSIGPRHSGDYTRYEGNLYTG